MSSENGEFCPKQNQLITLPNFRESHEGSEGSDSSGEGNDAEAFFRSLEAVNALVPRDTANIFGTPQIQPGAVIPVHPFLMSDRGREPAASTEFLALDAPPPVLQLPAPPNSVAMSTTILPSEMNLNDCLRFPMGPPPPCPKVGQAPTVCPASGQPQYNSIRPPPIYTESASSTPRSDNPMDTDVGGGYTAQGQDYAMGEGEGNYTENASWEWEMAEMNRKAQNLHERLLGFEENFSEWVGSVWDEKMPEMISSFEQKGFEMAKRIQVESLTSFRVEFDRLKNEICGWYEQAKAHIQMLRGEGSSQNPNLQISDVDQFLQTRLANFEQGMRGLVDPVVGRVEASITELQQKIQLVAEVDRLVREVPNKLRDHSIEINGNIDRVVGEWRVEMAQKISQPYPQTQQLQLDLTQVKVENAELNGRLDRLEKLFGGQEVPWEKMLDMYKKVKENIQGEVRQELDAREHKVIEMLVTQQLEEKFRDYKKEEHFEKLRGEIFEMTREQVRIIAENVFQHLQKSKEERRKLRSEMSTLQKEVKIVKDGISSNSAHPQPLAPPVTMGGNEPKPAPAVTLLPSTGAGLEDTRRAAPSAPRAHIGFEIDDGGVPGANPQHFFVIDDEVSDATPQ